MSKVMIYFLAGASLCHSLWGQTYMTGTFSPASAPYTARFEPFPRLIEAPFPGAPYSAEEEGEMAEPNPDGVMVTRIVGRHKVWRDSQGRTRLETPVKGAELANPPLVVIEITDPVTGFRYTLDTQNRVAHREKMPPSTLQPRPRSYQNDPRLTDLGEKRIEGVLAKGQMFRQEMGRDAHGQPIYREDETWMVPSLRIGVLARTTDSHGVRTVRVINLKLGEPDRALFQVPPDYQIVDETRPFEIRYSHP